MGSIKRYWERARFVASLSLVFSSIRILLLKLDRKLSRLLRCDYSSDGLLHSLIFIVLVGRFVSKIHNTLNVKRIFLNPSLRSKGPINSAHSIHNGNGWTFLLLLYLGNPGPIEFVVETCQKLGTLIPEETIYYSITFATLNYRFFVLVTNLLLFPPTLDSLSPLDSVQLNRKTITLRWVHTFWSLLCFKNL